MKTAIIWWWAAGMMTAATLIESGVRWEDIMLFEKNKWLWAKVIISGWGRCNVTTWIYKSKELLANYPRWSEFLKPAFQLFWPRSIRRRFESHWVPLKQEDDLRIFPCSDDGKHIVGVFEDLFAEKKLNLCLGESVNAVMRSTRQNKYEVVTSSNTYFVDNVVITTWWNAYAHTWSTGDGYSFAKSLWHKITQLWPSLNSFKTAEEYLYPCSWIAFQDAVVHSTNGKAQGPVLLTHFWVTWPAIFAFSSLIPYEEVKKDKPYKILLQPLADKRYEEWNNLLLEEAKSSSKKELSTILRNHLPRKFVDVLLIKLNLKKWYTMASLSKDDRKKIANILWSWIPLHLIQRRPGDEFVTAWWVSLDEVHKETCESLISPWLYFAWEILDIDWYTGWFNLSSSRATGKLVGEAIGV